MTTQPTNLPVPSESPRDLKFNAGKIDEFVTSFSHAYTDRFGNDHYTIEGIRWLAQQAMAAFGYVTIDSFQDGATLTRPNQVLRWKLPDGDGDYYRWDGSFGSAGKVVPAGSTPATTGGVGKGAWVSVGYAAALNNLLSAQPGSSNILGLMLKFTPVAYGALANATDDTAAFTACMAAMPSGATMDLQGLTYSVTDIEVTKPMRIINGTINVLYGSLKGGIYAHDTNNVHVHNVVTIVDYANKASYTSANVSGIHFENCTDISAVNCTAIGSKNDSYLATGSWGCPIHAYQCDSVTFYNCEVSHSDKEGCMTRFCNDVIMNTIIARDCNYSGVGTSGGDRVMATNIYSYRSGLSNLSFNSNNFTVSNLYSEGNKKYNGLALGHAHEAEQYSFSGTLTGITVIDSAETGIYVSKCNNISISGAVIQGCGTVSPGNGINIIGSTNDFANVNLSGVNINTVNGNGIQVQTPNNVNINISASTFRACSASALKINANGYTLINGVMFRGNGNDVYATPYDNQTSTQARAESLAIKSCDFENTSGLNVSFYGHKRFTMDGCTMYNFSSNATKVTGSILCTGSLSGVAYPTPDIFTINNTAFLGSTASGAAIPVVIYPDGVSTGKVMSIKGCHFANPTTSPISAPSASYSIVYNSNTRGSDSNTTTVSVPASGTLSVSNGNQTTFNFPSIIRRDSCGNVSITSYGNGSLVLTNYSPSPTGITLQW